MLGNKDTKALVYSEIPQFLDVLAIDCGNHGEGEGGGGSTILWYKSLLPNKSVTTTISLLVFINPVRPGRAPW